MIRFSTLALLLFTFSISAQALTLKLATVVPDGTNWMKEFQAAGEEIEQKTEGRVKLKFFAGGVMGSDSSVLRKMRIGQLQGGALGIGALSRFYNGCSIYSTPFLFKNLDEVRAIRPTIDPILEKELDKKGIVLLGLSEGGFAKIMSNTAVGSPESLKDKKSWIPEGDLISQTVFNEAGISPVALPISDVYTGLQTGLLDTITINASAAIALQWHTKIKYVADEPVVFVMGSMAVSKHAFKKLSSSDQTAVKNAIQAAFKRLDASNQQDEQKATAALKAMGVTFLPMKQDEVTSWKQHALNAMIKMSKQNETDAVLLQQVRNKLKAYRKK